MPPPKEPDTISFCGPRGHTISSPHGTLLFGPAGTARLTLVEADWLDKEIAAGRTPGVRRAVIQPEELKSLRENIRERDAKAAAQRAAGKKKPAARPAAKKTKE